jgi:hypothetical protein
LLLPPGALRAPCPLCCVSFSVPYLLSSFLLWGGGQTVQRTMPVYPRRSYGNSRCRLFAHLLVCISRAGLELVTGSTEPSWFLSVMWSGEALCRLGVWDVRVLLLLGVFYLPSVAPASQQDF